MKILYHREKNTRIDYFHYVFQMSTEKPTTEVDNKRTERLARLKELHLRRVRIEDEL